MRPRVARTVWLRACRLRVFVVTALICSTGAGAQSDDVVGLDGSFSGWAGGDPGVTTPGDPNEGDDYAPESFAFVADGLSEAIGIDGTPPCDPARVGATWRWRAEALALWRSAPRSRPLFSTVLGGDVAGTALDANQLQSDPLAAPRLSLFRDAGCGPILEANYLWAGNFFSQRSLPFIQDGYATSPLGIFGNVWGPPETALNSAQATLLANLQTAELNFRERFLHGVAQFIVGFRWLQWNESLRMQDTYDTVTDSGTITGRDVYLTDCFNNLYGGQIGIDAVLLGSTSGFRVDGLVKAGAFYNDASQRSTFAYVNSSPFEFARSTGQSSPDGAAFVGEIGMTAVMPIHCNLDFRVGYFGLWIEGIAQPTNQLSKQTLTQIDPGSGILDTTGGVLLQGLSLGLEGRW